MYWYSKYQKVGLYSFPEKKKKGEGIYKEMEFEKEISFLAISMWLPSA